jgi:hypothetical protein
MTLGRGSARLRRLVLGGALVVGAHLALALYFAPPEVLLGPEPVMHDAHGLTLERLGRGHGLAQPGGLIGAVAGLASSDFEGTDRVYRALLFALHLLVPIAGMAAARIARATGGAVLATGALFSALWWFDSLTHGCWYSGRVGWLVLGLGAPFAVLAVPAAMAKRPLPLVGAVSLLALAAAPLREPAGEVFASRAPRLFHDLVEVLSDDYGAGGNVRAALRVAIFFMAAWVLRERWHGDRRDRSVGVFLGLSIALAYLGGYAPVAWPVDPYLLLVPAGFVAAVPAGALLAAALKALPTVAPGGRVVLALGAIAALPAFARTVLSYAPALLPERVLRSPADLRVSALVGPNERHPDPLRHTPPPPFYAVLAQHVSAAVPPGAVLVRDRGLAATLSLKTASPVLGPLALRGEPAAVREPALPEHWSGPALADRVRQYDVRWLIVAGPLDPIESRADVFEPVGFFEAARVYRVRNGATAREGNG